MKGLISMIIPCWNCAKFVDECLESVARQTYKNFELVLINDGSSDDTLEKLKLFASKHPEISCNIISKENEGVSVARNVGISVAKGEFVCFMDADDMLAPNFFESLINNVEGQDWCFCAFKRVKESYKLSQIKLKKNKQKTIDFEGTEEIAKTLFGVVHCFNVVWNKIYRLDVLKQVDGFPNLFDKRITYGEDLLFNFNYALKTTKAKFIREKLYYYRLRKGGAVKSKFNELKLTVFLGHDSNIKVAETKYPNLINHARGVKCISSVEMLFRILPSQYKNQKSLKYLFDSLYKDSKYLLKAKGIEWYKRFLIPLAVPIIRLLFIFKYKPKETK